MNSTLSSAAITLALAVALAPTLAQAEDEPLTANIALTSKYKFRGQDQSDAAKNFLPAVQGGFDYSSGGFYIGNWNSSIGFAGGTEVDVYAGFSGELDGFSYDVGVLQYYYPGDTAGNTTELYGSVGFGPLTAKYSRVVSKKWFGVDGGRGTGYLELNAEVDVGNGVTLIAHLGTTQFSSGAKSNGVVNYNDYKLGVGFEMGKGFSGELAYVGATKRSAWEAAAGGDVNKSRLIFTVSKSL